MNNKTSLRVAAYAATISFLGLAAHSFASSYQSSIGKTTADALLEATRLDAHSDFLEAFAIALNEPFDEFPDAMREAWAERTEELELAEDQYEMRLQVFHQVGHGRYLPELDPAEFDAALTNTYFPFPVGQTLVYEKTTAEGVERVEVTALADTIEIDDIECRQVQDTAYLDGVLLEDTIDWYAQHTNGDVWYMGEISKNYDEDGFLEDIDGSWRHGKDGAQAGILMPGTPVIGQLYRQEYWIDEAEDVGRVVATNETVVVPAGTFTGCLKTEDGTALEPDAREFKYYAPGVGLVLEVDPESGERLELIQIIP
ncbi:MAG: hypothetical protein CMJ94_05880 [Planctomycetes bacterium]|nr:hypothetical protein [Planctomycetota bacterium]